MKRWLLRRLIAELVLIAGFGLFNLGHTALAATGQPNPATTAVDQSFVCGSESGASKPCVSLTDNGQGTATGTITAARTKANTTAAYPIHIHNICRYVHNKTGNDLFVPFKTKTEWVDFLNNKPANVMLETCAWPTTLTIAPSAACTLNPNLTPTAGSMNRDLSKVMAQGALAPSTTLSFNGKVWNFSIPSEQPIGTIVTQTASFQCVVKGLCDANGQNCGADQPWTQTATASFEGLDGEKNTPSWKSNPPVYTGTAPTANPPSCPNGQALNANTNLCGCPYVGQSVVNGVCACPAYQTPSPATGGCQPSKCNGNQIVTISGTCSTCPGIQVPDAHATSCICPPISNGVADGTAACKVGSCNQGYYPSPDQKSCVADTYTASFGACPAACGTAASTLSPTSCTRNQDSVVVDVSFCSGQTKSCNATSACVVSYTYAASFGACPTACGTAASTLSPSSCTRNDGTAVDVSFCSGQTKSCDATSDCAPANIMARVYMNTCSPDRNWATSGVCVSNGSSCVSPYGMGTYTQSGRGLFCSSNSNGDSSSSGAIATFDLSQQLAGRTGSANVVIPYNIWHGVHSQSQADTVFNNYATIPSAMTDFLAGYNHHRNGDSNEDATGEVIFIPDVNGYSPLLDTNTGTVVSSNYSQLGYNNYSYQSAPYGTGPYPGAGPSDFHVDYWNLDGAIGGKSAKDSYNSRMLLVHYDPVSKLLTISSASGSRWKKNLGSCITPNTWSHQHEFGLCNGKVWGEVMVIAPATKCAASTVYGSIPVAQGTCWDGSLYDKYQYQIQNQNGVCNSNSNWITPPDDPYDPSCPTFDPCGGNCY